MTAPQGRNPFDDFLARYGSDPVLFVREVVGKDPYPWQARVLAAIGRGERRISIRSGHGVGKTACLAWAVTWHAVTKFPQKTVCTAATGTQLSDALIPEVKGCIEQLPPFLQELFTVKAERIELAAAAQESFISFRSSRPEQPEALAGVHSENVLLIGDEASGIPEQVFEAASGSMSGHTATTILAGNPVRRTGLFSDTQTKLRERWVTEHVSCLNNPNVSADFIEDMKARYGEDSNAYRVRVLGEFPIGDDDTVIPFELMEMALTRDVKAHEVRPIWGVDCARFGSDKSAIAKRRGNVLVEPVQEFAGLDTMQLVGRVKDAWDTAADAERPSEINVDVIGLGAGVVDRLRELNLPVRGINVGESPALGQKYVNLRSELWFKGRAWLEARDCSLAGDEALGAELIGPRFTYTSSGKQAVESKDDMKKRGVKSPNKADAFLLTLASDAVTASGAAARASWREPIRRPLKLLA